MAVSGALSGNGLQKEAAATGKFHTAFWGQTLLGSMQLRSSNSEVAFDENLHNMF